MKKMTVEAVKTKFEQDFIKLISEKSESQLVRFWSEEERMCEDDILDTYPDIYSVEVFYKYPSRTKRPSVCTRFMRNDVICSNPIIAKVSRDTIKHLRTWATSSGNVISDKLIDQYEYYLMKIKFYFLKMSDETFVVPNIYIENMQISRTFKGKDKDIISTGDLAKSLYEDYEISLEWAEMLKKNQKV